MSRTFVIHVDPTIADPAHLIACSEIINGQVGINYSSFNELKDLIHKCELNREFRAGMDKGINTILEAFDIKPEEYLERIK
jgi:hypothetical protein